MDAAPLSYRYAPEALAAACAQAEARAEEGLKKIVATPDAARTFDNSFHALDDVLADYVDATQRLSFMKDVHPDASVRAAAAACEERSGKYLVGVGARRDLYLALKGYLKNRGTTEALDPVDQRLVFLTMRDFRRNGLELPEASRRRLVEIRSRIAELSTQFEAHLDENHDGIEVTRAELAGLPEGFIRRLKRTRSGKYVVTTQYPDYYPLMENARSEAVRRRMELAFEAREAGRNVPLLAEAIRLRDEAAHLLGYATHVDFVTEDRMAKSSSAVAEFLDKLRGELRPGRDELNRRMLALKFDDTHDVKAQLSSWDWRYYLKRIKNQDFNLDDEKVRAYFPANRVVAGMLDVYSRLLHVSFREVPDADTWAPGVKLYEVRDVPSGKLLAKFYTDFYPRAGKYGHAASFGLGPAREVAGGYQVPLTVLVVNFNPPAPGKGAYLSMMEVETLFHEFGHVMHSSLTTAPYASLSGTNVAVDFVEAPSQMLENWVYQPEVLKLISEDPEAPGRPMPEALAARLSAARTYDSGIRYTRQNFLATLDHELHSRGGKVDPDAVEHVLWTQVMGYPADPAEHMVASFGHLMNGYDGGYYGYLWSQVFAEDMFTRFQKEGVLNPETGRAYRDTILASGRVEEPDVLLRRFLGREPNEQAFLRIMGVLPSAKTASLDPNGAPALATP